jgi:hypothetical protein
MVFPILASVWPVQKRVSEQSMRRVAAQNIAKTVMDEVTHVGYSGVEAMQARSAPDRTISLSTERHGTVLVDTYTWELEIGTAASLAGLFPTEKHVAVKVNWQESSEPKVIELSTIVNEGM